MNKKAWLVSCLVAVSLLLGRAALAQQDFSAVEVKVHEVTGGVYYLEGAGGNVGLLVGDDGVLMVDTKSGSSVDGLLDRITELCEKPIRFAIITHWHFDHVGGNEKIAKTGAEIIAHNNVRKHMGIAPRGPEFRRAFFISAPRATRSPHEAAPSPPGNQVPTARRPKPPPHWPSPQGIPP